MISAVLLAIASLSAPSAVPATAAYAGESVTAGKGHPAVARGQVARSSAPVACHPEPSKGRVCRHHVAQAEQAEREAVARTEGVEVAAAPR